MQKRLAINKFFALISLMALFLLAVKITIAALADQESQDLFISVEASVQQPLPENPTILRSRWVNVNFALLEQARPGDVLTLNLFDELTLTAVINERSLQAGVGEWIGHVEGSEYSQFIFIAQDGVLAGHIDTPDSIFQVQYASGYHLIAQIDQSAFPEEAEPLEVNLTASDQIESPSSSNAATDDGSVIDVLVVYTPNARNAAGGPSAMQALVNLAVEQTNLAYANSGIAQRINLVHTEEVAYSESGDAELDLNRLRNLDGFMDQVHAWRDAYSADLVNLIVETASVCGISYQISPTSPNVESLGFSLVKHDCATGYYSFAHELGHNMGARHDWYVDSKIDSPITYNHGYVYPAGRWRTIMAYDEECMKQGFSCTRKQFFSNPEVLYNGVPMGVPANTSASCVAGRLDNPACDADNHLTFGLTALAVANFRQRPVVATLTPTPTLSPTPSSTPTPTPTLTSTSTQTPTPTLTPVQRTAGFPFYEGFETGILGPEWFIQTTEQGRVQVSNYQPYRGVYCVLLDDSVTDSTLSVAALILKIDLSQQQNVLLDFWWREFLDDPHAEDGVFISDDDGGAWKLIYSFNNGSNVYRHAKINLVAAAAQQGLSLNDHFKIKFQFYDDSSIPFDGYALDEIRVEPAAVLLVDDDDNAPNVSAYYTRTLESLGASYWLWDTNGTDQEPPTTTLSSYPVTIWFTGHQYKVGQSGVAGPGAAGEAALASWLEQGNCLMISSQDYMHDHGLTPFAQNYLGVAGGLDPKFQTVVTGTGAVFGGLGPYTLVYTFTNFSDVLTPTVNAQVAFMGNKGVAALTVDQANYHTTFWAFPFEALPRQEDREVAMAAFLDWCSYVTYLPVIFR